MAAGSVSIGPDTKIGDLISYLRDGDGGAAQGAPNAQPSAAANAATPAPPAAPPPPPPPTPAQAGYAAFISDPQNAGRAAHAATPSGQSIIPPMLAAPPNGTAGVVPTGPQQIGDVLPLGSSSPAASAPQSLAGVQPMPDAQPAQTSSTGAPSTLPGVQPLNAAAPPTGLAAVRPLTQPSGDPRFAGVAPLSGVPASQAKLATDQAELQRLQQTGSGASQVKNPWLRGLARVGDIAGAMLLGKGEALIPGTTAHNLMLQGQAGEQVATDQNAIDRAFTNAHQGALAEQDAAAAYARLHPKQEPPKVQFPVGGGAPYAIDDGSGREYADGDPTMPADLKAVLDGAKSSFNAQQDATTTRQTKPLSAQQAASLNSVWDRIAAQHHLPTGQFTEGMSANDASSLSTAFNNVLGRQQGDTRIIVNSSQPSTPNGNDPMVQAIIDGRVPAPNVRTKQGAALMRAVTAADPTYDASRYNTYQRMQTEATSGKTGQAINSLNTVNEHIDRALQNLPNNGNYSALNWLENTAGDAVGKNPTGKFQVDTTGIAGEWSKLVDGGVATESEMQHVQSLLSPNASPQKMRENLAEVRAMTNSKLAAIRAQVQSATHPGGGSYTPSSLPGGMATSRSNNRTQGAQGDPLGIR